jgi:hypothetical protein
MIDETVWQKCDGTPLFARVQGERSPLGQMWRRRANGKWEYRQDAETPEQVSARAY